MLTIFTGNYTKLTTFIFQIYDFENTGFITREDVRTILSHLTLKSTNLNTNITSLNANAHHNLANSFSSSFNPNNSCSNFKFEKETYQDRLESQEELHCLLDKCFKLEKKIDFSNFTNLIENFDSNIFIYLLIFLLEKRPFSNKTLENYKFIKGESEEENKQKNSLESSISANEAITQKSSTCISPAIAIRNAKSPNFPANCKLLASPSLLNKFMPAEAISKSPTFQKRRLGTELTQNQINTEVINNTQIKNNLLSKYLQKPSIDKKGIINSQENCSAKKNEMEESIKIRTIPVSRTMKKNYNELKENIIMFLQHLGVNSGNCSPRSNCEDSEISSNMSNSDQIYNEKLMDDPNDIKMKIENEKTNSKEKVKNNLNRFESIKEKHIKFGSTNKEKTNAKNNKLLNMENFQKTNNVSSKLGNLNSPNGSNSISPRGSKMDENQLYPSKKYEGDVNYINKKIYQASLINQKLTQEYMFFTFIIFYIYIFSNLFKLLIFKPTNLNLKYLKN